VYPSTGGESFGIVLLEAMAACRGAVLAGDNPGYASVMGPRPESLFDPLDTKAMAEKILTLMVSKKDRADANQWQHQYVRQFDIAQVGPQIVDVYRQALHNRTQ
jgi:phosphatidyl-myo-inositol alpha-mannosyltransferase